MYASVESDVAFVAASDATNSNRYECWARSQTKYVLGSDGLKDAQGVSQSFVVGFGTKPPVQAHHRAASCPTPPAPCSFDSFNAAAPNPHVLYGALVGGECASVPFDCCGVSYVLEGNCLVEW